MKTSTKIICTAAFVGTLGFAGLSRVVGAKQPQSPVAVVHQHHIATQIAQASDGDGDGETNDDVQEQQEAAKLQPLAKITGKQAQQAAEASRGAKSSSVKLENEDGNLVYSVKIGQQDVKVDAGNGKVLYAENDNQEDEKNEANRPKSSIQVPDTGDSERETNDDSK
ncbi:PepSY domain-containing protein (plasmid) [Nostoc sp. UHCC 0302]|uniref:PepSY domain-containing protein n=1 Tax=Nostoc sp. UHCC 0302 TaxID=3134896 RepID=UPI00311C9DEC